MKQNNKGFTLTETIVVLSIMAVLLCFALPSFSHYLNREHEKHELADLQQMIQLAKSAAIDNNCTVTLCHTKDFKQCSGTWSNGIIVFLDHNGDRIIDNKDRIIYTRGALTNGQSLSLRSFPSKHYLQFKPNGLLSSSNGTFTLFDRRNMLLGKLIINKTGRVKITLPA